LWILVIFCVPSLDFRLFIYLSHNICKELARNSIHQIPKSPWKSGGSRCALELTIYHKIGHMTAQVRDRDDLQNYDKFRQVLFQVICQGDKLMGLLCYLPIRRAPLTPSHLVILRGATLTTRHPLSLLHKSSQPLSIQGLASQS
jgi:hypothetical protein